MIIERPALVFRGVKQRVADVLDIVQHLPALFPLLVVAVDHCALAARRDGVVADEAARREAAAAQRAPQLWPALLQLLVILQRGVEKIAAVLDVRHARLPEEVEQVHRADRDVAQPVQPGGVPHHLVNARAGLQLLPQGVGIDVLKAVLRQDHRDDRAEHGRLGVVVRLARQDDGLGKGVHRVGVFGHDHVVQPSAFRAKAPVRKRALAALLRGVAQLPPVFRGHDAPLQIGLAGLVAPEDARELLQPGAVHGGRPEFLVH